MMTPAASVASTAVIARPPVWVCHPNFLTCQFGHLRKFHQEGADEDRRGLAGYVFTMCRQCAPHTYAFGIATTKPEPSVFFYAITQAQYQEFRGAEEYTADDLPPAEILYKLGYNPHYRPTR